MGLAAPCGGGQPFFGVFMAVDALRPASYPRRLLVAVAGLTPQVVTESVYALATQPEPFIPTEVHLITTQPGADRVQRLLLNKNPGHFHRLVSELNLPPIDFTPANIHLLRDADGHPLEDIRTASDNASIADQIIALIRHWAQDDQAALHVSLAGGRKTLSYYLGTALSLFGRSQDRLSHVLVDAEFENLRDFFYPTQQSHLIYNSQNCPLDASEARVSLAEIPFVRLNAEKPGLFQEGKRRFSELVEAAQQAVGPVNLLVFPVLGEIRVKGHKARLRDADMAFLLWFIAQGWDIHQPWRPPVEGEPDRQAALGFLKQYQAVQALHGGTDERPLESLKRGMDLEWFRNRHKHFKHSLMHQLGSELTEKIRIKVIGKRPTTYGLAIDLERVEVKDFVFKD